MQRALRTLGFVSLGLVTLAGSAPAGGIVVNPQAGVTATHLTSDPAGITDQARVGYAFGGNLRFGGSIYLSPGAYVQRTSLRITTRDTLTATTVRDVVGVNSIYVPLKVGFNLSTNAASPGSVGLRVFGGPALTIISSVKANDLGITKEDYEGTHLGFEAGAGLDLTVLTIDVSYEKGLGKTFKNSDAKQDVLRALIGIKL